MADEAGVTSKRSPILAIILTLVFFGALLMVSGIMGFKEFQDATRHKNTNEIDPSLKSVANLNIALIAIGAFCILVGLATIGWLPRKTLEERIRMIETREGAEYEQFRVQQAEL